MPDRDRRRKVVSKSRPNRMRFILTYFGVVSVICVLLVGWKGLIVAPVLILVAFLMALSNRRKRGVVGALMDEGDRDFERIRREREARRRARDGASGPN